MPLDDELLNKVTWKIPNALALIGSRAGDERNAMTASWITQLSMEPVLIGVAVDNEAVTCRLITDGGSFTVNASVSKSTRFISPPRLIRPRRRALSTRMRRMDSAAAAKKCHLLSQSWTLVVSTSRRYASCTSAVA